MGGVLEVHRPHGASSPTSLIAVRLDFEGGAVNIGGAASGEGLVIREMTPGYDMDEYGRVEHDPLDLPVIGERLGDVASLREAEFDSDTGVALAFGGEELWLFCVGDELRCELVSSESPWMAPVTKISV